MRNTLIFCSLFFFLYGFSSKTYAQDLDTEFYYRLTTKWQGDEKSLDVVNDGKNNQLQLAKTGNYSGQCWKLTPLGEGYYRLTTQWQGDEKSLDVVNDGKNNKLQLAKTGAYSGQYWKLEPLGEDYYRITTKWQGDEKSLDVVNDGGKVNNLQLAKMNDWSKNNKVQLAKTGKYSGQYWKLTKLHKTR
jgi:hypothetical protein